MKIISWNVAGLRAMLKKKNLENMLLELSPDIVCLQETKAEEHQVELPNTIKEMYPYRFWESTKGTTQRKGLSGTAIWSKERPERQYNPPEIDEEGRITTLEFSEFTLMCVYTPNSQGVESDRLKYRTVEWHESFKEYINCLKFIKPTILCGDFNVAHKEIDIHNPSRNHKTAGFLDIERSQFQEYLDIGYVDQFRKKNPDAKRRFTYWNQLNPKIRENNSGWRIDYFLTSKEIKIKETDILDKIYGSDHCPIYLEI